jgi:nitrite reductase/ring-hydroxylating ferredoxin subunit
MLMATIPGPMTRVMDIPDSLLAPGVDGRAYTRVASVADLPMGTMVRFTSGDLDVLVVHSAEGLCVIDDRCPHMSAPLSLGTLTDCVVACPLHRGAFDVSTGDVVQFPTTGGLDADGGYHAPWTPVDSVGKPEPTDLKARARALTRVRRLRYYPVRINGDDIEVQLPI